MDKSELKLRTKSFGLCVLKLVTNLLNDVPERVIAHQLTRSALSVGANDRSACRGRSRAEFLARLGIVLEEVDESCYWLEIIIQDSMLSKNKVADLLQESNEQTAIFFTATSTVRCEKMLPLPKS